MTRNIPALLVAALVVVIIVFMMCAFQVRFTETAVVTRFDEIVETVEPKNAGLHFKMPWPIDRIHRYDTRLRSFETDFRQLGTEDQKTIVLTAYATWRIADGRQFLKAVSKEDAAGAKIRDLLENRVSIVLRTHPLSHLVNVDPKEMKFAEIEKEFLGGIREQALKNYGIEIVTVGIKRLGIPESVTKEVFARMKEDRQATIKELTSEGQAKGQEIRSTAAEVANKILARAEAYAKQIEAQGDAIAASYNKEFMKDQKLSNLLKTKETLLKILESGQSTLVLDANQFEFLKLLRNAAPTPQPPQSQKDVAQGGAQKTAQAESNDVRPPRDGE
ncbi:MAG TPA: protease modulator HflC [Phycisphaerae bacterium]|nr:protease modulator HflC [Phycisphaerae bacterium]